MADAAARGDNDCVRLLLDRSFDRNATDQVQNSKSRDAYVSADAFVRKINYSI